MNAKLLVPAALRPVARRVARALRPVRHAAPLAGSDLRARVEVVRACPVGEAGRPFDVTLRVTNHSPLPVGPDGTHPVGVLARWSCATGAACDPCDGFAPLSRVVYPGESVTSAFRVPAPGYLGDYVATFAVGQRGGPAFEAVGPAARCDVNVSHPFDAGFNYLDIYAKADLGRDHWSASGPPSAAEFERLKPIKLDLLKKLGLTPDGRLLDVGCGTGLLAAAAEGFLSDRGAFFGTDLAPEAVEYCRRTYRRPNFRFAVNGMTTVPVQNETFDAVAFYSVFTHTYPDETALLLAEAARVLAPGGVIFADCFTSPLVSRSAGSRYAVEVNCEHLLRLAALAGLSAELVQALPWVGPAQREFFAFRRK
ncbi:MAG TPA: class I SAM-dependent methyltransferase [Urbifossiella sp.]|nr:class I SAM-dependent methyltransferase [Urbifossiella sp.]